MRLPHAGAQGWRSRQVLTVGSRAAHKRDVLGRGRDVGVRAHKGDLAAAVDEVLLAGERRDVAGDGAVVSGVVAGDASEHHGDLRSRERKVVKRAGQIWSQVEFPLVIGFVASQSTLRDVSHSGVSCVEPLQRVRGRTVYLTVEELSAMRSGKMLSIFAEGWMALTAASMLTVMALYTPAAAPEMVV